MYNNPENIGPDEILFKMANLGIGPNRNERFKQLKSYPVIEITKEEWIKRYCI